MYTIYLLSSGGAFAMCLLKSKHRTTCNMIDHSVKS